MGWSSTKCCHFVLGIHQNYVKKEGFSPPMKGYMCLYTKRCVAVKVRLEVNTADLSSLKHTFRNYLQLGETKICQHLVGAITLGTP